MKNNIITYFLTNTLFLGGGLSIIFSYAKNDSYISIILGTLLGVIILYLIHKYVLNKKLTSTLKIFYFIYLLIITTILLTIISTFISSYYLPKTNTLISCLPLIFLAIYSSKNLTKVSYVAIPLFFISVSLIIFKSTILITDIKIDNIYPILNNSICDIFKAAFIYAILSTIPSLLLINENVSYKDSIKYYLLSSLFILITTFILITSLGNLINTLSYPEYSILRKVRFLKFVENIEAILAITWIFDIFITLSIISYKLKQLFNSNSNLIPLNIIPNIMVIIYLLVNNNYHNLIVIYKYHIIVLLVISSLIIFVISILGQKKSDT